MNTVAAVRAQALAKFEAAYGAMLSSAEELRTVLLAEAGLGTTHPRVLRIMRVVAEAYNLPLSALASHTRTENYVLPRHIAMVLCLRLTTLGTLRIGTAFNRDHSSVLHAKKAIGSRLLTDHAMAETIRQLEIRAAEALKAA